MLLRSSSYIGYTGVSPLHQVLLERPRLELYGRLCEENPDVWSWLYATGVIHVWRVFVHTWDSGKYSCAISLKRYMVVCFVRYPTPQANVLGRFRGVQHFGGFRIGAPPLDSLLLRSQIGFPHMVLPPTDSGTSTQVDSRGLKCRNSNGNGRLKHCGRYTHLWGYCRDISGEYL